MPPRRYRQSIFRILRFLSESTDDRRGGEMGYPATGPAANFPRGSFTRRTEGNASLPDAETAFRNDLSGGFGESLRTPGKTVSENRRIRHSQLHIGFPLYGTGKFSYLVSAYMRPAANDRRPAGTVPVARTDRERTPMERTR